MKVFAVLLLAGLSGCGSWDRAKAGFVGVAESCHGGVVYLQFSSGVSPAYNPDGSLRVCQ